MKEKKKFSFTPEKLWGIAIFVFFAWFIFAFLVFPNLNTVVSVFYQNGHFTTEVFTKLVHSAKAMRSLRNSLILAPTLSITVGFIGISLVLITEYFDIKGANIIVAGGYGMGSKENFRLVHELAEVLGAEVGASRAAVDAGFTEPERQVGQTGVTVRPKLYIACGISGQIQHTAGMEESAMIISINTDPDAPINKIADYAITGDVNEVIPKMIKYYKQNSK